MLNIFSEIHRKNLLPVIPVFGYAKRPIVPWRQEETWIKDIDALEKQGELYEYINTKGEKKSGKITGIGLITGLPSGIMVIDLDRNHGENNVNGVESFEKLLDSIELTDEERNIVLNTYTVKTPSGGLHLYFKYRPGLKSSTKAELGIDLRTDGGIIIAPGSLRKINGNTLTYEIHNDSRIQDMPDKLFGKLGEIYGGSKTKDKREKTPKNNSGEKRKVKKRYYTDEIEGGRNNALTSYLGKMVTQPMFRDGQTLLEQALLYNTAYLKPPLDEEEVSTIVNSVLSYAKPPYCKENGRIVVGALVEYVLQNNPSFVRGNMLYIYNPKTGIYDHLDYKEQQKLYYSFVLKDEDIDPAKAEKFSKIISVKAENYRELFIYENRYINCLNGVIDSEKDELLPYTPDIKIDAGFNGNFYDMDTYRKDYENSKFKEFLESILDEDTISTLQQAWGVMLCPNSTKVQQIFIYKGEGSNGKSSLFDIQTALLRDKRKSLCGISLGRFGDEFILSMAEGKRLNIVRDDDADNAPSAVFKSVVCGEDVTVNRKNRDHVIMNFNMAWFYGLNRMPIARDKSFGFFRRPILIPFNVTFGNKRQVEEGKADKLAIPGIVESIIEKEMDTIFMWAYEGLKKLREANFKIYESKASLELM